jgi:hypothetical protein
VCLRYTGCVDVLVVDSSSLVTLARCGAVGLLELWPNPVVTVQEVYRETVEVGSSKGYADAAAIREAFGLGRIAIRPVAGDERTGGMGAVDWLVLQLAQETPGSEILANDHPLLRKAEQRGLPAFYTAEFVWELGRMGRLRPVRRDALLRDFVAEGRYTEDFMNAFLMQRRTHGPH